MTWNSGPVGAMTIDVEDWFQVQGYASVIARDDWEHLPRRVEANTDRLLAMFAGAGITATFFTLGWIAERHPSLVRRIAAGGHEVASHGHWHGRVDGDGRAAFRADVARARACLEDAAGTAVRGYRAPTFSVGPATPWAWDVLAETGHVYSSSLFPVRHDLYGDPDAPRVPHRRAGGALWEIPMTTLRVAGRNLPCAGGWLVPDHALSAVSRGTRSLRRHPGLLSPSLGDRSRPTRRPRGAPRRALAPSRQPRPHRATTRETAPGFPLGAHRPSRPRARIVSVRIVPLERGMHGAWDRFVASRPEATFFHQAAMPGLIARVFGHRDRSLMVLQDGDVVGILPLVELRTPPVRPCPDLAPVLRLCRAARGRGRGRAGIARARCRPQTAHGAPTHWNFAVSMRRARNGSPRTIPGGSGPGSTPLSVARSSLTRAANLKAIPRKQRAVVRKGIERRLAVQNVRDPSTVWRIYAESVRNLGSPVFPRTWFEGLLATFHDGADATIVVDAGRPVSAVLNLHWRNEVLPYYGGGLPAARECQAYDTMYWNVMCRAASRGATIFDFGRSKEGTGAYAFKRNWGFEPTPLAYRFLMREGKEIPEHNPLNPKYRMMIAAWKKLPMPVANLLGPHLVRGVG